MSFDPPPLPPQGYLLAKLGYVEESVAAIAIDVSLQTLTEYRKKQIGPDFTIVGRTVLYHPTKLEAWLAAGGTRAADEVLTGAPVPEPQPDSKPKRRPGAKMMESGR